MINRISTHISKIWLKIFLSTLIGLFLIVAFGDIVNNILRNKYTFTLILENFFVRSSFILENIFPVSGLIATLFTLNKLKQHNELIAIIATGFSRKALCRVFLLISLIPFSLQFLNKDLFSSYLEKYKSGDTSSKQNISFNRSNFNLWFKGKDYFGSFLFFSTEDSLLSAPVIYLIENEKIEKIIKAKEATSIGNGSWLMKGVEITGRLASKKLFPIEEKFEQYQVNLNKTPQDFQKFQTGYKTLGLTKLYSFIDQLKKSGFNVNEYLTIFYEKISLPLTCILFVLFPIFSLGNINSRHSSPSRSLVFGLVFSILFWGLSSSLKSMGLSGSIPVWIGVFGAPILIATFITYYYSKLKRL